MECQAWVGCQVCLECQEVRSRFVLYIDGYISSNPSLSILGMPGMGGMPNIMQILMSDPGKDRCK